MGPQRPNNFEATSARSSSRRWGPRGRTAADRPPRGAPRGVGAPEAEQPRTDLRAELLEALGPQRPTTANKPLRAEPLGAPGALGPRPEGQGRGPKGGVWERGAQGLVGHVPLQADVSPMPAGFDSCLRPLGSPTPRGAPRGGLSAAVRPLGPQRLEELRAE
eukprot:8004095-Pyramimonas_sp.AAC.1